MKTIRKKKAATPSQDAAVQTIKLNPSKKNYHTLDPKFVKSLQTICARLEMVERELFSQFVETNGRDLQVVSLWLETQNQWRIGHGLLQRLTAPTEEVEGA